MCLSISWRDGEAHDVCYGLLDLGKIGVGHLAEGAFDVALVCHAQVTAHR